MKKVLAIIAAAVLFGGVAGATVLGISYVSGVGSNVAEQSETTVENNTEQQTEAAKPAASAARRGTAALDVSDIVEEAMPQVVSITNTMVIKQQGYSSIFDYIYGGGYAQDYEVPASGSGVILKKTDDELLIVTNNHVVTDSKELQVTF
ncbi:MAG: peptidase S1, partial [Eubacteriales bacterium]|nr:peptidase S1 [Eubacteriales bacterium]